MQNESSTSPVTNEAATPVIAERKKPNRGQHRVITAEGTSMLIGATADTVKAYISGFKAKAPLKGSGGYTSFCTVDDGFTNQRMVAAFTAEGVSKMMALLIARAADILISDNAEDATAMAAALEGLKAYQEVAITEAKDHKERQAMENAIATLAKAKGCTPEAARAALANFAATPIVQTAPPPVAAAEETTLAKSGGTIEGEAAPTPRSKRDRAGANAK
jgi:hypothetical protein